MFHSNTERLIDYWRARKTGERSPPRSAIDPIELSNLLPQVFMLGRHGPGRHTFRLAGGLILDLHQRDLRRADFLDLWRAEDRLRLASAMEGARSRAEAFVIRAAALAEGGGSAEVEVLLAPLEDRAGEPQRTLGFLQPTTPLVQLHGRAVASLEVHGLVAADGGAAAPALRLAAVGGRLIA